VGSEQLQDTLTTNGATGKGHFPLGPGTLGAEKPERDLAQDPRVCQRWGLRGPQGKDDIGVPHLSLMSGDSGLPGKSGESQVDKEGPVLAGHRGQGWGLPAGWGAVLHPWSQSTRTASFGWLEKPLASGLRLAVESSLSYCHRCVEFLQST
jgi:hypothetical protein